MDVKETKSGFVLRLARGEEVVAALTAWAAGAGLPGAEVSGIGALEDVELGYFDIPSKSYRRTVFPVAMELASLHGNLAWAGAEPVLHAHAVLAGADLVARAGHLFRGTVAVTAELFVRPTDVRLERETDPETGLRLLV